MRRLSRWLSLSRWASIATIVGALWVVTEGVPRLLSRGDPPAESSTSPSPPDDVTIATNATPTPSLPPPLLPQVSVFLRPTAAADAVNVEEFPQQAHLRNGEQHVALRGKLGVSATFAEVASEPIATLRINQNGAESTVALPMAGTVFTARIAGVDYRISVLRLNLERGEVDIQLDKIE